MNQPSTALKAAHPRAKLKITGIPLPCDCEKVERTLKQRGGKTYEQKIEAEFVRAVRTDRRVLVELEGLATSLIPWFVSLLEEALTDCGCAHFDLSAILLRR